MLVKSLDGREVSKKYREHEDRLAELYYTGEVSNAALAVFSYTGRLRFFEHKAEVRKTTAVPIVAEC
jgi:hypothetical protein